MKPYLEFKSDTPVFQDNTGRFIKAYVDQEYSKYKIFYRTVYVQGMVEKVYESLDNIREQIDENILEIFKQYKTKLNKQDRLFFKSYFDHL